MSGVYDFFRPLIFQVSPETAHGLAVRSLHLAGESAAWLTAHPGETDDPRLGVALWGHHFTNPIGLAAGFDKNAEALPALSRMGFASLEFGTVTPRPQGGNPKPRLFRLPMDGGVINRMGFNNDGQEAVAARLERFRRTATRSPVWIGANIGRNKTSTDAVADYVTGLNRFVGLADYLVINVSSPNTPGLRDLQQRQPLTALITATVAARNEASPPPEPHPPSLLKPPLLLKIAPDLSDSALEDVIEVALAGPVDGLIVGNTTISRPEGLRSPDRTEAGGLSGRPLFAMSTAQLARIRQRVGPSLPLIGCGGVASAEDAYAKIRAGATLIQLYTALVYEGPALIHQIKRGLLRCLQRDGVATLSDAVGVDVPA